MKTPHDDLGWMRRALALARRGFGATSPNPMVGAVVARDGRELGSGWHRRAGLPHAEVEALNDARARGNDPRGATIYVTLEPCSTHGRTPPCTEAILGAGIRRLVVAATDPNPRHAGRGFELLRKSGVDVVTGVLADRATSLNEAFNHWILHRTPFVTVKAAMTLDGKIATAAGESKWITGTRARAEGMRLRRGADAVLVGVNTVIADDPSLTVRGAGMSVRPRRRIILDSRARTPLTANVVADEMRALTTVVVTSAAPLRRVAQLRSRVKVIEAPAGLDGRTDLRWLMEHLGADGVTALLVEGGGEVNASFLESNLAQRVAFFYAPMILGGRASLRGVAGTGATSVSEMSGLESIRWRWLGDDLFLTARVRKPVQG